MDISVTGPKVIFQIPILGGISITETVVNSWGIIIFVALLCFILTRKMEVVPKKKTQIIAEKLVNMLDKLVHNNMGERHMKFAPYIMALMTMSALGSLISLLGLRSVTSDINTTMTWAFMTFFMIQFNGIKSKGIGGYLKGFTEPVCVMLPINIISEAATPISMGFRHFGNVAAGMVITTLLYAALSGLTNLLFGIAVPILQVGIPAVLSIYFDLFTAALQAFIFCMLTMVFIANNDA